MKACYEAQHRNCFAGGAYATTSRKKQLKLQGCSSLSPLLLLGCHAVQPKAERANRLDLASKPEISVNCIMRSSGINLNSRSLFESKESHSSCAWYDLASPTLKIHTLYNVDTRRNDHIRLVPHCFHIIIGHRVHGNLHIKAVSFIVSVCLLIARWCILRNS